MITLIVIIFIRYTNSQMITLIVIIFIRYTNSQMITLIIKKKLENRITEKSLGANKHDGQNWILMPKGDLS